jgi:hypothetical protein
LEAGNAGVLDLIQVLHTLGDINHQVRASCLGPEAPDLTGLSDIPTVLVRENAGASLEIVTRVDLACFNRLDDFLVDWSGLDEETVVLVLRLGEGDNG